MPDELNASTKPQCHHIMDSGSRCQTPPLKDQTFCYYHRRLHATFILPGHPEYIPPTLDSLHSIQVALHHIYLALSKGLLERRLAQSLLYTIRLAKANLASGISPDPSSVEEITPAMQKALYLDEKLEDQIVRRAGDHVPRSTDLASRRLGLDFGANCWTPSPLDSDPKRAIHRSNDLSTKTFSRHLVPEFTPEVDVEEWKRYTSDLPAAGEAGTAQQQMNCRRVLQILRYDEVARRMAGVK